MATEGVVPCRTSSTTSRQIDLESLQNPTRRFEVERTRRGSVERQWEISLRAGYANREPSIVAENNKVVSRKYDTTCSGRSQGKCEENRLIKIGRWCSEVKLINDDTSSRLCVALSDVAASSIQSVITEISRATVSINSMHP
ncbi:Krueppel-like factor 3 isoform X3, partial [Vespula maculifrons]